jgi:acetyl-CoA C-acetyltransferase
MPNAVVLGGARTPIGKLSGALASLPATRLGALAISGALARAGVAPEDVDYVFMGHVLQAGAGQITARQAAVGAGIPMTVPATTVNKVCLSGLNTIYLANQLIAAGEAEIVVAGGMESMTNAPYLLPGARAGLRMGDATVVDSMLYDGLFCAFDRMAMGESTERYRTGRSAITRQRQDAFAAASHERATAATKEGRFGEEIVRVEVPARRGDPVTVETDEGVRPGTTPETLAKLRGAFAEGGTITAGNASQISDGAAAVVVASPAAAERLGTRPLGRILGYGQVAGPDTSLLSQPSHAAQVALERAGLGVGDVDLFEINEAFAAVALASMDDLSIPADVVNVNGGAIALGHPIGASGTRLALTLLLELGRRGGGTGVAALCGGGGQGDALLVRVDG